MVDWQAAKAAVETISGKWTLVVLAELTGGGKGYNELVVATGMENKALDRTLRRLIAADLVDRKVHTGYSPPHVSYHLTPQAKKLLEPLDQLARWWSDS